MEKELKYLSMAVSNPERPYVAIVGGAKISGKIDVLRSFLKLADKVLIGGAMTYTFLKAQGVEIGSSLVEDDKLDVAREALDLGRDKLLLPIDHVVAKDLAADAETEVVDGTRQPIPEGWKGLDIGPRTIEAYREEISGARMIVWNGPMGVFESRTLRRRDAGGCSGGRRLSGHIDCRRRRHRESHQDCRPF